MVIDLIKTVACNIPRRSCDMFYPDVHAASPRTQICTFPSLIPRAHTPSSGIYLRPRTRQRRPLLLCIVRLLGILVLRGRLRLRRVLARGVVRLLLGRVLLLLLLLRRILARHMLLLLLGLVPVRSRLRAVLGVRVGL